MSKASTHQPRKKPLALRLKPVLPRSLFGRTLLIIVLPTLITLSLATYVFFKRHWYTVTNRMTYAVAGDIATTVDLLQHTTTADNFASVQALALSKMDLVVSFAPGVELPPRDKGGFNPLRDILRHALNDKLSYPFTIDMQAEPEMVGVSVGVPEGVYVALVPERRIYTPTTEVFIAWMTGSSILLSAIALLFMRNQVRPVRRLADAAEAIGKGQDVPWFKLEGASEVRQAAAALMVMRDRLKRQINQRTAMLAGVSHDLRTPLTRMRLQIALMPQGAETDELNSDIAEMEAMLEAYLAFARGEESEPVTEFDLAELLIEVVASARRQNFEVDFDAVEPVQVRLRRNAMKRCIGNLVGNAMRYGKHVRLSMKNHEHAVDIRVDDDGPGIAEEMREDVFRPFTRLEESRNASTGGIGLGLTIARDIARFHGGDVILETSPMGGLCARVWLPR